MADYPTVYSISTGKPFSGIKPNTRRPKPAKKVKNA